MSKNIRLNLALCNLIAVIVRDPMLMSLSFCCTGNLTNHIIGYKLMCDSQIFNVDLHFNHDQHVNFVMYCFSLNNIESQVTLFFKKYSWDLQVLDIKLTRTFKYTDLIKS